MLGVMFCDAVYNVLSRLMNDDDISLLTHDERKCYNNVKHCKPNTVNERKKSKKTK